MDVNVKALLIFLAGLILGGGGYHLISGKGDATEESKAAEGNAEELGAMLGAVAAEEKTQPEPVQMVAMPEGFENVCSIKDIMTKAGPRDRFQALMSFVEGIDTHEIEKALEELRANTTNQFDPEAMFAAHLLSVEEKAKYLKAGDSPPDS